MMTCYWLELLVLALCRIFLLTRGALLNAPCTATSDCEVENSNCRLPVSTCGSGTCQCALGFRDVGSVCKREISLDYRCNDASDVCRASNAECIQKRCNCSTGYRRGLKNDDCIIEWQTQRHNASCVHSIQCHYNLKCIDNRCRCEKGFKLVEDFDCVRREIGDSCNSNSDCSQIPNAACSYGRCSCTKGHQRLHYLNVNGSEAAMCSSVNQTIRNEDGKSCNLSSTPAVICKAPLVCIECSETTAVCTRPMMLLTGVWSIEWLIGFVDFLLTRMLKFFGY